MRTSKSWNAWPQSACHRVLASEFTFREFRQIIAFVALLFGACVSRGRMVPVRSDYGVSSCFQRCILLTLATGGKPRGNGGGGGYGSWFLVALMAVPRPPTRSPGRRVRWPGLSARRSLTLCSARPKYTRLRRVDISRDRARVSWTRIPCFTTRVTGPGGSQEIHVSCLGPHGGPGLLNFVCPNPKKKRGKWKGNRGGGGGGY